jgi:hypothetical protein
VFQEGSKPWIDRCFQLVERIDEHSPNTTKNRKRIEGIDTVITNLMALQNG